MTNLNSVYSICVFFSRTIWRVASTSVLIILAVFVCTPVHAEQNPLAYVNFAFIAGDWAYQDAETGFSESFIVRPILESGTMKAVLTASESDGSAFNELWILGWDPSSEFIYLDVYSTGGYRAVMNGRMIVPGKVWVFETPINIGSRTREKRTFTKLGEDELAIKFELDLGSGKYTESFERTYARTAQFTVSGSNAADTMLTELEVPESGETSPHDSADNES